MENVKEFEIAKSYFDVSDVETILGVSRRKAYYIIANLNKELEKSGAFVIPGKVNSSYFVSRWNGEKTK